MAYLEYLSDALYWPVLAYLLTTLTLVFYLAVMNLKRNREALTPIVKVFAYPALGVGLLLDLVFNFTIGTIMFLEIPQEWLMTARLNRHLLDRHNDWRDVVADWFAKNFLDPFDPKGTHVKRKEPDVT